MARPDQVERGVHVAPYLSAGGNTVLVAVTSTGRRLLELDVPIGDNPLPTLDLLWGELNARDPISKPLTLLDTSQISATIAAGVALIHLISDPIVLVGRFF